MSDYSLTATQQSLSNILIFISWYGVVQLIGTITFPLCWKLFTNLPDRGYTFAKSLGILLLGFILWFGTSCDVLRNDAFNAWLTLVLLAYVSFIVARQIFRKERQEIQTFFFWVRSKKTLIMVCELLFLVGFAFWAMVRAHDPAVNHTEQPMDLMFMNGIWTSPNYPPHDPWLSGYGISYYYFGYWMLTTLGRLAHQPPEIAYNVGQACWFGLLLLGTFGIGYNLLTLDTSQERHSPADTVFHNNPPNRESTAILGGLLSSVSVVLASNFHGVLNFFQSTKETRHWWWWPSSRVIQDHDLYGRSTEIITEFPIFSYILGDNHPHVIAMPFVVLAIAFALNLFLAIATEKSLLLDSREEDGGRKHFLSIRLRHIIAMMPAQGFGLLVMVIACGALISLNSWDFPSCLLLLILSFYTVIHQITNENARYAWHHPYVTTFMFALIIIVLAFEIYFPYFLTAQNQFAGFVPNIHNPTHLHQFLLMFGPFFLGTLLLIRFAWKMVQPSLKKLLSTIGIVLGIPQLFLLGYASWALWLDPLRSEILFPKDFPALSVLSISLIRWLKSPSVFLGIGFFLAVVLTILRKHWRFEAKKRGRERNCSKNRTGPTRQRLSPALCFTLLLAAVGLVLVYLPEFIYVHDLFGTRMNTIFKFYYQAWLFLGLSSAYASMISFRHHRYVVFGILSVLLILVSLVYCASALYHKTRAFSLTPPTLNALVQLQKSNPEELAAIRWIQKNTRFDAVVIEGKGQSYNSSSNRISTFTGRATFLGWEGHEIQWRGKTYAQMTHGRSQLLDEIYNPKSTEKLTQTLAQRNIDYVYIGPWERQQYSITKHHEALLQQAMDLVFENKMVRIFQRCRTGN